MAERKRNPASGRKRCSGCKAITTRKAGLCRVCDPPTPHPDRPTIQCRGCGKTTAARHGECRACRSASISAAKKPTEKDALKGGDWKPSPSNPQVMVWVPTPKKKKKAA